MEDSLEYFDKLVPSFLQNSSLRQLASYGATYYSMRLDNKLIKMYSRMPIIGTPLKTFQAMERRTILLTC